MNAQLIPSVSGKSNMGSASGSASNLAGPSTSIRIPRPPKGMGVVGLPQRINEHRWQSESSEEEGEDLFHEDFNVRDFDEEDDEDCWTD